MSFAELKKNRNTDINKLVEQAEAGIGGGERPGEDNRFWVPARDKAGNGFAVIRFLPGLNQDGVPWVRFWDHAFKGPTGQWYIEKSLTSIGQNDPLSELNMKMWNNGVESDKNIVRQRKRQLKYVANILVVQDPTNPENQGKVFLFRFGKKIFDKIIDAMKPQFPDEQPIDPFNMWSGANFVLKIRKDGDYPNYDASQFKAPSPISEDDALLETIFNSQYDLSEWSDPKNYKTYDQLKQRLTLVLGETSATSPRGRAKSQMELDDEIPSFEPRSVNATEPRGADEDDDVMAHFARLAAEE